MTTWGIKFKPKYITAFEKQDTETQKGTKYECL